MSGTKPYRGRVADVPLEQNLREDEGWINMQVQFLIDEKTCDSKRTVVGWTVLPPGAAHERHAHPNVDEFWIVLKGKGVMYTDEGEEESSEGDYVFTPAGYMHGFKNTSDEDVVLVWGWSGAGSLEKAGYSMP